MKFFILSLFCLLVLSRSIAIDMFYDGVIYASVAQNYARDICSFWKPCYTWFVNPYFDQPPLWYFVLGNLYRLFGYSRHIEFFLSVFCGFFTIVIMMKLWNLSFHKKEKSNSWWPVFLFLIIPIVPWGMTNNMLDNPLALFGLCSVYFYIKGLKHNNKYKGLCLYIIAGFFIFLSLMVKGFPGLFSLTVPFFYYLIYRNISISKVLTAIIFSFIVLCLLFVLLWSINRSDFVSYFSNYLNLQVISSLTGKRDVAGNRFYLIHRFTGEFIVPVFVCVFLFLLFKFKKIKIIFEDYSNKNSFFYFLLALSASLPLFFVPKQYGQYILPSLPLYSISLAYFFEDISHKVNNLFSFNTFFYKTVMTVSIIFFMSGFSILIFFNGYISYRDKNLYRDVVRNKINIPLKSHITFCPPNVNGEAPWGATSVMQRYYLSSVTSQKGMPYLMVDRNYKGECETDNCILINTVKPERYAVYHCNTK